jgi:imidazole glycerol-phosphate synthase subunit HisF
MKDYKDKLFLGANKFLFDMAGQHRRNATAAEKLLWSKLCNKQLGVKFRRQHPLYAYIVDFYCHSHRLIIEVDGLVHNTEEAKLNDSIRSQAFEENKIKIIRFTNDEVFSDLENVLEKIRRRLADLQEPPP